MPEIVKKNPVNDPTQKSIKNHSKFTPNYSRYDTHRFGLNTPHFVMAGVADDDISMRSVADVDTYSLKAPLMQPVKRNMDYFQMTMRSLLPNNAEYIITNPLHGDDVVAKDVNAVMDGSDTKALLQTLATISTSSGIIINYKKTINGASSWAINDMINRALIIYEIGQWVFSGGSLPKYLGYDFDDLYNVTLSLQDAAGNNVYEDHNFDEFFQIIWDTIDYMLNKYGTYIEVYQWDLELTDSTGASTGSPTENKTTWRLFGSEVKQKSSFVSNALSINDLLDLIHSGNSFWNVAANYAATDKAFQDADASIATAFADQTDNYMWKSLIALYEDIAATGLTPTAEPSWSIGTPGKETNFLRLVAYQCACAEFYTSDKVDNIYSSLLYLQNEFGLACLGNSNLDRYHELNGVPVQYDAFSGKVMVALAYSLRNTFLSSIIGIPGVDPYGTSTSWAYWHNLFSFTRSLKYEDYFVGARKQPLAVGDVSVGVDTGTNTVDVVDVTKKIQVQRFLNQVNRIGRKFTDYVKGILGDRPMKDAHEPIFLGHVADTFGAEETDNTGDGQLNLPNSTTSKLRNNSSRFGFDVHIGEPSIIIGITNYDIVRVYSSYTDRENMHVDRYDMFNPFMQFVGDQPIFQSEIKPTGTQDFGYTLRYMEYKQKVDQCAGGFAAGVLPGYARIVRKEEIPLNISSDFIRSRVNEMDEFYISLTGRTLGTRWNFIVRVDNEVTAHRPMAFAPSIL